MNGPKMHKEKSEIAPVVYVLGAFAMCIALTLAGMLVYWAVLP